MPTYTSNYGWTKPSGSDNVDISVLNDNLDGQDSTIHDAFLNMAPPFSESSTYAVDDIVLYDTGLYKCHTAVVTPGSWTGSTNWQVYKLSEGGSGGGGTSNYNDLTNQPQINGNTLTGNKTTSDLGINADNVMMSDGDTSVEDAITPELEAYTLGDYFVGYMLRIGRLRILSLYNGTNLQIAVSKQLDAKDIPAQITMVGSFVAVDANGTMQSRYLEVRPTGTLHTSGDVFRGGFTLIYNV